MRRGQRGPHKHREVAALRRRWRRPARLWESQMLSLTHHPNLLGSACRPLPRGAPRLGDEAGDPLGRKSTAQKFSPTLRPFVLGRPPGARFRRSLRSEDGDSLLSL